MHWKTNRFWGFLKLKPKKNREKMTEKDEQYIIFFKFKIRVTPYTFSPNNLGEKV